MKSLIKKKKGDMFQVIVMLAILLAVAMVGMLTFVMTTKVNQYWDDSGLLNESEKGTDAINTLQAISPRMTDYAIFFLFLGMNIGITIAAIRTNYNPATIMIFIFLLFLASSVASTQVNSCPLCWASSINLFISFSNTFE